LYNRVGCLLSSCALRIMSRVMLSLILPSLPSSVPILFFHPPPPTDIYTLSLHDALPICTFPDGRSTTYTYAPGGNPFATVVAKGDRKSTRLNSSHSQISYAVFCLKKKKQIHKIIRMNINYMRC